jgi:Zn finger protein HypA/HybF involved in hydrogenase expression
MVNDKSFIHMVRISTSLTDLLRLQGLAYTAQPNRVGAMSRIEKLNLDIAHWQSNKRGKSRRILQDYLVLNGPEISSSKLKYLLIKAQLLEYKCKECGLSEWQNKLLALHLDHKDGNRRNNQVNNLRLLCPNCHSLTETYGKAPNIESPRRPEEIFLNMHKTYRTAKCVDCKMSILTTSTRCMKCAPKHTAKYRNAKTKIMWPSSAELKQRLKTTSYRQLAKELGVSDVAIKKRIRNHPK